MSFVVPRVRTGVRVDAAAIDPSYQAWRLLQAGYFVALLVAGVDKFLQAMTDWDKYLAPVVGNLFPITASQLMLVVGGVEIVAAVGVALAPRVFGYLVFAWYLVIAVNLLIGGRFYEVALFAFGLAMGALALACLSALFTGPAVEAPAT